MENNKTKIWLCIAIAFILGWAISYVFHTKSVKIEDKRYVTTSSDASSTTKVEVTTKSQGEFPDYALETLEYIREHNQAPSGYVGGRVFQNREGQLPKSDDNGTKLNYKEWDVHPKVDGQNRGAERLVTSSVGEAYFTSDHYRSFQKIQ